MLPGSRSPKPAPAAGPPGSAPAADRFAVILAGPESAENIGLVARAMKNTGFSDLRIVKRGRLPSKARKTAVHSGEILDRARLTTGLEEAVGDLHLVFAATAKTRAAVELLTLDEAVRQMAAYPPSTRVGLLFGNERTGLTAAELRRANFAFTLPQAGRQPSYNLAAAVLLTLFALFTAAGTVPPERETPLPRREQEDAIRLILRRLEENGFIHGGNREHVTTMMHDLLGRLAMNEKDRRLLLALFTKGVADRGGSGASRGA